MVLLRHLAPVGRVFSAPALTLGNFDGVHRGHQEILRRLVATARAQSGTAIVVTFTPHPAVVLAPARAPQLISDLHGRVARMAASGVDVVVIQRFTRAFAAISAEDFVRRFLVEGVGVRTVVVGHRVSFGHDRRGDSDMLRHLGAQYGFDVDVVGPVQIEGLPVSSSEVRRAISAGDLDRAEQLLGSRPSVCGRVVHGHHRGTKLGFPTANLRVVGLVAPPNGVYAVQVRMRGGERAGVANIGTNPTFGDRVRSLEVHLFDFAGDVYGQRIEVVFVQRLRAEVKFPTPQALVEQIGRDVVAARQVLGLPESP